MSIQHILRYFAVGTALLLLSALSLHAQDDTTRRPDSLAARLLGFEGYAIPEPPPIYRPGDTADLTLERDTAWGRLNHLKPAIELSETPAYWERPPVPLGTHPPTWP